jgi:hypothetical protein
MNDDVLLCTVFDIILSVIVCDDASKALKQSLSCYYQQLLAISCNANASSSNTVNLFATLTKGYVLLLYRATNCYALEQLPLKPPLQILFFPCHDCMEVVSHSTLSYVDRRNEHEGHHND